MVIVDQAPSLKVYDFKEEAVLCDIPLGTLEKYYLYRYIYLNLSFGWFSSKVRIEIRI